MCAPLRRPFGCFGYWQVLPNRTAARLFTRCVYSESERHPTLLENPRESLTARCNLKVRSSHNPPAHAGGSHKMHLRDRDALPDLIRLSSRLTDQTTSPSTSPEVLFPISLSS